MKTGLEKRSQQKQTRAASRRRRGNVSIADSAVQRRLDDSAPMRRQREQINQAFGQPAQSSAVDEEELLQGRFTNQLQGEIEEEELLQGKSDGPLQKQGPEEEELLQGKLSEPLQRKPKTGSNRNGLPEALRQGIESLAGADMSAVRVHYNSAKPAQLNALAYARGNDIHLGPGQERHLPHEAWHVVQQQQGRVQPTAEIGAEKINDDPALEREADVMGEEARQFGK